LGKSINNADNDFLMAEPMGVWVKQGACKGMDTNIFFPERGNVEAVVTAKNICFSCPVMMECREWALRNNPPCGIWGGFSKREIRRYRREEKLQRIADGRQAEEVAAAGKASR